MRNIKPILFNTEMVQAILAGRKTQTRRFCAEGKEEFETYYTKNRFWDSDIEDNPNSLSQFVQFRDLHVKSKFTEGDILWVRERFEYSDDLEEPYWYYAKYREDYLPEYVTRVKWKPSIHMPKEAARIFLKVTDVRVERLQDISEEDAIAEGVYKHSDYGSTGYIHYGKRDEAFSDIDAVWSFETLWQSINAKKHPWESNPWVWVYEFERIEKPAEL